MTAIGLYVTVNGIVMASDGIAYDGDGIVREMRSKQLVIPSCNAGMTASGSGPVLEFVGSLIRESAPQNFDEIDECMPECCRIAEEQMRELWDKEPYFAILYGGWSPSKGDWCGRMIANYDVGEKAGGPSEPPFVPIPIHTFAKPRATPEALKRFGLPSDPYEALTTMPANEFACRLMMAQRHSPMILHGGGTLVGCGVGGFCEVTSLFMDSATTQIAYRWMDAIGREADPSADPEIAIAPALPTNPA